ncbi:unnamed protein product [Effrenium voratum]|nr:unnamed protein product [Effrenium voratum]CAJ1446392.1 unnamed protein product [Effrenium voratum]
MLLGIQSDPMKFLLLCALVGEAAAAVNRSSTQCYEHPRIKYGLKWQAQGHGFFDLFHFIETDSNNGATHYVPHYEAKRLGIVEEHSNHAIMRAGPRSPSKRMKRTSAKIFSKSYWNYFLVTMRFTHVPFGCGVWPAFWTHAPRSVWPNGGELDILEWANDFPGQVSFHTGERNKCRLHHQAMNPPGCTPMPDTNGMNYDCDTHYPSKLGCAPNRLPIHPGNHWANQPGVVAAEWTPEFVKVFYIPEAELEKAGLEGAGAPQPDDWDQYIMSYLPFKKSEDLESGTCPNPDKVLWPQQLVFQTSFCGDWAGKTWGNSGSCVNVVGPTMDRCDAVDPLAPDTKPESFEHDCCSMYVYDENQEFKSDEHFHWTAYWNFTYIKASFQY